jgi:D-sedoheptulose 7-phosphate isomerase
MHRKEQLTGYVADYRVRLLNLFDSININELEALIGAMVTAFKNGNTLFVAGNGGSAATVSHMQADFTFFVRYFTQFRPRVISLADNVPIITAVGNDNSFDDIFVEQMRGMFKPGDVLLSISASGNSKNIIKASEYANSVGGKTLCFVGFQGGKLKEICDVALFTPNDKGDYGPIEDLHMILNHMIVNFFSKDEEFLSIKN